MVEYLNEVTLASTGVMALLLAYFTDHDVECLLNTQRLRRRVAWGEVEEGRRRRGEVVDGGGLPGVVR